MYDQQTKIVILGAGSFAEEILDVISDTDAFEPVGFVESVCLEKCGGMLAGLPIIWIDEVSLFDDSYRGVCAVGSTGRKGFIERAEELGLVFTSIVHPSAHISSRTSIGEGTVVGAGAILAASSVIGSHVVINRGNLIGHHVKIGDYVTISPGVNIAGRVTIADYCYIGMGSIILDGISVGEGSVIGAGALVTKDVPEYVQVVGVPARVVKELR